MSLLVQKCRLDKIPRFRGWRPEEEYRTVDKNFATPTSNDGTNNRSKCENLSKVIDNKDNGLTWVLVLSAMASCTTESPFCRKPWRLSADIFGDNLLCLRYLWATNFDS